MAGKNIPLEEFSCLKAESNINAMLLESSSNPDLNRLGIRIRNCQQTVYEGHDGRLLTGYRCTSKWCHVCQHLNYLESYAEWERVRDITRSLSDNDEITNGVWFNATLTLKTPTPLNRLRSTFDALSSSLKQVSSIPAVLGFHRGIEAPMNNEGNGSHSHIHAHALWFVHRDSAAEFPELIQSSVAKNNAKAASGSNKVTTSSVHLNLGFQHSDPSKNVPGDGKPKLIADSDLGRVGSYDRQYKPLGHDEHSIATVHRQLHGKHMVQNSGVVKTFVGLSREYYDATKTMSKATDTCGLPCYAYDDDSMGYVLSQAPLTIPTKSYMM